MTLEIIGIGTDIEEISRFEKNKYNKKKSFYEKIFSQNEIEYCLSKLTPYPHFTARFCAKEAAIKALKDPKILLSDIEIRMKNSVPVLSLPNGKTGMVSIAHTKNYAIAFVMIYE